MLVRTNAWAPLDAGRREPLVLPSGMELRAASTILVGSGVQLSLHDLTLLIVFKILSSSDIDASPGSVHA